jgi:F0F1-type ATP synthase epsilon subunit
MTLKIYTMRRTVYEGETTRLTLQTVMGEVTILNNHEPYVTIVEPGDIRFSKPFVEGPNKGEIEERVSIKGGFLEVRENNEVRVLADE